jgi:hypothetical protein
VRHTGTRGSETGHLLEPDNYAISALVNTSYPASMPHVGQEVMLARARTPDRKYLSVAFSSILLPEGGEAVSISAFDNLFNALT